MLWRTEDGVRPRRHRALDGPGRGRHGAAARCDPGRQGRGVRRRRHRARQLCRGTVPRAVPPPPGPGTRRPAPGDLRRVRRPGPPCCGPPQACVAGTRILVPENRLDEMLAVATAKMADFPVGDPGDQATAIGPMVSERQWERVQGYIRRGAEEGARIVVGGPGRPEDLADGYFVRPTLFADVTNHMTIAREEIFGPVLSIITYRDEDHAVEIANDTEYGLHAYVFSSDPARAHRIASRLEAGRVSINGGYEPRSPFGGFKQSGIGREYGTFGLEGFLEPRAVMA
ncbi:aldehyde dehydrogenase family protein [Streptomyces sp. NPDC001975]